MGFQPSSLDNAEVERALAILCKNPYRAGATDEQEWACALLYRTLLSRLLAICRRLGLDAQESADVVHPKFVQFVTRDVTRVGPSRADLERWMSVVCRNAARTALSARITRTQHELDLALEVDAATDSESPALEPASHEDVMSTEQPRWLDARFPKRIDKEVFLAALESLSPAQKRLFNVAYRHIKGREGAFRLPAAEIARELGTTPGTVSVRLSELMKKLRQFCQADVDAG